MSKLIEILTGLCIAISLLAISYSIFINLIVKN